jgi:hypothetical protein
VASPEPGNGDCEPSRIVRDVNKLKTKAMKRFTKTQKAIVDAYLAARASNKWDDGCPVNGTPQSLREALVSGKVYKEIMDEIEIRYTSITSIILASTTFSHLSNSYKAGIRTGFRRLFNNLKID